MPMITVRYVTPEPRPELPERIAALAAQLAADHLGKKPDVTAVLVEPAVPGSWFVGGQRPTDFGRSAFWLTIAITAGTNLKAETAAFIRAAFDGMQDLLGPVREESYVLVQAADGDGYGYGGRTQNARWAETRPLAANLGSA